MEPHGVSMTESFVTVQHHDRQGLEQPSSRYRMDGAHLTASMQRSHNVGCSVEPTAGSIVPTPLAFGPRRLIHRDGSKPEGASGREARVSTTSDTMKNDERSCWYRARNS